MKPKTLFEMAGAKQAAVKLSDSVLLIIDAQREYVDGALPLLGVDAAIADISELLARARKADAPVIHVMHKGGRGLFNPEGEFFEIVPALQALKDETVIEKKRISAFAATGLEEAIKRTGRKRLIIVGFMTHNCVSSTARAARDLGYEVAVVAAATATRDLPDGNGGVLPAVALQAASLAALADHNAKLVQRGNDVTE
ncbi:MAG: cysteine hydrolase family protein [Sideroxydans sp.]|nr:cysteine hydrolase family protein [Sideroxydans sp.]